ncbi:MAG: hypothetical protein IT280_10240 [Ignavibacteria bacterium]|nr:hypothetical protein [Ignavibacteria bacterium]
MKSFLIIPVFIAVFYLGCSKDEPPAPGDSDIVYVCLSNSAKTYHTHRDCSSLKQCNDKILEVTRGKARENERIICMVCKKKDDENLKMNKDSTK